MTTCVTTMTDTLCTIGRAEEVQFASSRRSANLAIVLARYVTIVLAISIVTAALGYGIARAVNSGWGELLAFAAFLMIVLAPALLEDRYAAHKEFE